MDIINLLKTRRSIRMMKTMPLSETQIEKILTAAMYAPSARNQQPWHFVVVTDRSILNEVTEIHPYSAMLIQAPLAILVCADHNLEQSTGYWVQDCSAATQNILIAAHGMGLGAVWLGVYPRDERISGLKVLFNIPENVTPLSLIAIGYADEEKAIPERYKSERIHQDKW